MYDVCYEITLSQKFNVKTCKWNIDGVKSHKPRSENELSEYVLPNFNRNVFKINL